jgi:hypothetical protein
VRTGGTADFTETSSVFQGINPQSDLSVYSPRTLTPFVILHSPFSLFSPPPPLLAHRADPAASGLDGSGCGRTPVDLCLGSCAQTRALCFCRDSTVYGAGRGIPHGSSSLTSPLTAPSGSSPSSTALSPSLSYPPCYACLYSCATRCPRRRHLPHASLLFLSLSGPQIRILFLSLSHARLGNGRPTGEQRSHNNSKAR